MWCPFKKVARMGGSFKPSSSDLVFGLQSVLFSSDVLICGWT